MQNPIMVPFMAPQAEVGSRSELVPHPEGAEDFSNFVGREMPQPSDETSNFRNQALPATQISDHGENFSKQVVAEIPPDRPGVLHAESASLTTPSELIATMLAPSKSELEGGKIPSSSLNFHGTIGEALTAGKLGENALEIAGNPDGKLLLSGSPAAMASNILHVAQVSAKDLTQQQLMRMENQKTGSNSAHTDPTVKQDNKEMQQLQVAKATPAKGAEWQSALMQAPPEKDTKLLQRPENQAPDLKKSTGYNELKGSVSNMRSPLLPGDMVSSVAHQPPNRPTASPAMPAPLLPAGLAAGHKQEISAKMPGIPTGQATLQSTSTPSTKAPIQGNNNQAVPAQNMATSADMLSAQKNPAFNDLQQAKKAASVITMSKGGEIAASASLASVVPDPRQAKTTSGNMETANTKGPPPAVVSWVSGQGGSQVPLQDEMVRELAQITAIPATVTSMEVTAREVIISRHEPALARHIAAQISQAAQPLPDRPVNITLNPEELGRVRLEFIPDKNGMVVSITAERPETLELMRRHIETLAQDLRNLGHRDVSFSFNQGGEGNMGSEQDRPGRVDLPGGLAEENIPDTQPESAIPAAKSKPGIDIRL